MKKSNNKFFAVFVLVNTINDLYAATTRPSDIGEEGQIGLPGGKIDEGENILDAAYRECKEEGWEVKEIHPDPINIDYIEGKKIIWLKAKSASKLKTYKEMKRLKPIEKSLLEISKSGYGNSFVKKYL